MCRLGAYSKGGGLCLPVRYVVPARVKESAVADRGELSKEALVRAALVHVPFDGWSEATFQAACTDLGVDVAQARVMVPRGALDLALEYHAMGDAAMVARMAGEDMSALRFRDRIAAMVRWRLEAADREAVRRGTVLFALPQHAGEGAKAIWRTADLIWRSLGDVSEDVNWYTKRATLAAVYGSVVLIWLGDQSVGSEETWAFLDRRIEDVMRIEKLKAQVRESPVLSKVFAAPLWALGKVRAPGSVEGLPGRVKPSGEAL